MSVSIGALLRRLRPAGGKRPTDAPPLPFLAHNIRLDDGRQTKPDAGPTMDQFPIFLAVVRMLRLLFPEGLEGKSIIDVGCLEGGYAVEFARLGMISTGLDVRRSNIENCEWVRQRCDLPNLTFVRDDANNIGAHGPFDVVFMCGLLYHLDRPRRMMEAAARQCRKAMFIHTHFTHAHHTPAVDQFQLGPPTENEGLRGRWYLDHHPEPEDVLDRDLRGASWANQKSFWLQKEELLSLIRAVGFPIVLEQYDHFGDWIAPALRDGPYAEKDRSLFIGIKP